MTENQNTGSDQPVEVLPPETTHPDLGFIMNHMVEEKPVVKKTGPATTSFTPRHVFFPKPAVFIGAGSFASRYVAYLEKTFTEAFTQVSSPAELQDHAKLHIHKSTFMEFCHLTQKLLLDGERFTVMVNNKAELKQQDVIRQTLLAFLESKRGLVEPVMYLFR